MGQTPSHPSPDPNTTIRVIGAGLPRTGTLSLTLALSHLLNGPVYHGGTQLTLGPSSRALTWTSILSRLPSLHHNPPSKSTTPSKPPSPSPTASKTNPPTPDSLLASIATETAGYVAITDTPGAQLVPELLRLYPSALVICTVREPDAWVRSMAALSGLSRDRWWVRWVLWPVPGLRHFGRYEDVLLGGRWADIYCRGDGDDCGDEGGDKEGEGKKLDLYGRQVWDRHVQWLRDVVPPERLFFFDVREGWEPLCGILGTEVPVERPFPRENDGARVQGFVRKMVWRGVWRWMGILGLGVVLGWAVWAGWGW